MKQYIGTKNVLARPMTRGEFVFYRDGTPCRADENPADAGYLVEYTDGGKANHPDHRGYISWSPADVFERSYKSEGMAFGQALEALKAGARIARKGWNGKGMFVFLLPGGRIPKTAIHDAALRAVIDEQVDGDTFEALPSIRMWTTNSEGRRALLTGWLASQTDMLSEDWELAPGPARYHV